MTIMSSQKSDAATIQHHQSIPNHPSPPHHQSIISYRAPMATKCAHRVHRHSTSEIANPSGFLVMSDWGHPRSDRSDSIQSLWTMGVVSRPSYRGPTGMFMVGTLVPAIWWPIFLMWCFQTFLGPTKGLGPPPPTTPYPFPSPPHPSYTFIGWFGRWPSWSQWPGMWLHGFPCTFPWCKDSCTFPA